MTKEEALPVDLSKTTIVSADDSLPETYLVVEEGEFAGRRYRLHKKRMVIGASGRGAKNDIDFDLSTLSARHAEVELRIDGTVLIRDLRSSNGTYLDEVQVEPGAEVEVTAGALIGLGPNLNLTIRTPENDSEIGSETAARQAVANGQRQRDGQSLSNSKQTPPGIRSDMPLGKILSYLLSAFIALCALFGILSDASEFFDAILGLLGRGGDGSP